ncbi:MAG: UvrD-helicase domain-containing protein [Myxococcaceae bacterium]|nr:UvrD-helicase domain-containing protein [Myxococcaceae bacterium]
MGRIDVVSASAGSGKTTRIARELRERIEQGHARPEAILATTFTNKAADELKERVRTELFRAGLTDAAMRLEGARIGTVNSVCGRLVTDFALDLGLSPELRVLDQDQAKVALRRVISQVVTQQERDRLSELASRFWDWSWQGAVQTLVDLARANRIGPEALTLSAQRSVEQLLAFLPAAVGVAQDRDRELQEVLERQLAQVDSADTTKGTRVALESSQEVLGALRAGRCTWTQWAKAKGLKPTQASKAVFTPIIEVAVQVDTHPQLRKDLEESIRLVFEVSSRTLAKWEAEKRELGVLDFVDQEVRALALLENETLAARLSEQLDLVLVDEFQDTNPLQLQLFTRLAKLAKASLWVGDQKQAIFGFRGTDPALMDAALKAVLGDKAPETLDTSYRSRAPLVALTSNLFAEAFGKHGVAPELVKLKAKDAKDAAELGPCLERWAIEGRNKETRLNGLADGVVRLLADPTVRIRDREDGALRRPNAGDVAILARKNTECQLVADALALRGVAATVRREGLLLTPEARSAVLALRLFIDERDRLAAGELARLLLHPDDASGWLEEALQDGALAFEGAPFHQQLRQARERFPAAGPLAALEAAIDAIGLHEVLPRWGASAERRANLDALRSHAVNYVAEADAQGGAATPAGLVSYLEFLESEALDSRARLPGKDAVVVSTWHAAKGLEWPVTVLALVGSDRDLPRFGFKVCTTAPEFTLERPLDGRWIRYWPNPFNPSQKTELRTRLENDPGAAAEADEQNRQELRLLYVGWTRARDRLVLAEGDGKWILGELPDAPKPVTGTSEWGGVQVGTLVREVQVVEQEASQPQPDAEVVASGPVEYPPAFISPSNLEGKAASVEVTKIGERMAISGDVDMNELGQAIHGFYAADRRELARERRVELARESLAQWGHSGAVRPEELVASADALYRWADQVAPGAVWHRELMVGHAVGDAQSLRGIADLVLETKDQFIVVDHKSFPGGDAKAMEKVGRFASQLTAYHQALSCALRKKLLGCYLHLAVRSDMAEPT